LPRGAAKKRKHTSKMAKSLVQFSGRQLTTGKRKNVETHQPREKWKAKWEKRGEQRAGRARGFWVNNNNNNLFSRRWYSGLPYQQY